MAAAFSDVTSATESDGDGVVSVSHTAAGSDRAVCIINTAYTTGAAAPTITYGGGGTTALWHTSRGSDPDVLSTSSSYLIAPSTSAQTATVTLSASSYWDNRIAVISMTGVHQTVAVGTPATATSGTGSPSVTVGSITNDDLVVDGVSTDYSGTKAEGADQTSRFATTSSYSYGHGSTQPGTAGGDMTWTYSGGSFAWGIGWCTGAAAFKAAAAAAGDAIKTRLFTLLGVGA